MIKKNLKVLTILMVTGVFTVFLFTSCGQSLYDVQAAGSSAGKFLSAGKPQSITSWQPIPNYAVAGGGGHCVYGKTVAGDNIFLAAYWNDGSLGYSPGGMAWDYVSPSITTFGTSFIKNLAFLNNTFWAVGQDGKIATSPNGLAWTAQTQTIATGIIYAIALNNDGAAPVYIAVSDDSKIIRSDGSGEWEDITGNAPSIKSEIHGVTYGSGTWVIVCSDGSIYYSTTNGNSWTQATSVTSSSFKMVAFGTISDRGDFFIAVSHFGVARSSDGTSWVWDDVFPSSTGFNVWINCILFDGTRFIVSGAEGAMAYYDGSSWTTDWQESGGIGYWTNKIFAGKFVNGIAYDPEWDEYIATGGDATPIGAFTNWEIKKEPR